MEFAASDDHRFVQVAREYYARSLSARVRRLRDSIGQDTPLVPSYVTDVRCFIATAERYLTDDEGFEVLDGRSPTRFTVPLACMKRELGAC